MSIVEKVDLLTKEHGTTFAAVERKCGLANGSIRRWDTNTPSIDKLEKVADYFNVSTDYLLGRTEIKNPSKAKDLPEEFTTPEEAVDFLLNQNVIMGFGGFDINKLNDEEKIEFANELLNQLKLLSYKYKK